MEFLSVGVIIVIDEYKLPNLFLVNTRLKSKDKSTHIRKEADKEIVSLERDRMVAT
jgi:hypothetical protein